MSLVRNSLPFLEALFATDFSDVRFKLSELPARLNAAAFACGNEIYLRPGFGSGDDAGCVALLAHELAHVVQFRQGRVSGTSHILNDLHLEHEAELAANLATTGAASREMDALRWSRPVLTSRERHILCRPDLSTKKWFGSQTRPDWAGEVIIHFEELHYVTRTITRPVGVYGLIAPGETKGRAQAPEPVCGWRVSTAKAVPKRFKPDPSTGLNVRNTGMIDAEKGHIMALELGGPDIPENIVPQWAKWQGCGEWRKFEVQLEKEARKVMETQDHFLMFQCVVHYFSGFQNVRLTSERKLCVPVGFSVFAPVMQKQADGKLVVAAAGLSKTFNQQRDETDDMIALRSMEQLEQKLGHDDFSMAGNYDDVTDAKRKGKLALEFAKAGQDARYGPPPVTYRPVLTPYLQTVGNQFAFNSSVANAGAPGTDTAGRRILKAKRTAAGDRMDTAS